MKRLALLAAAALSVASCQNAVPSATPSEDAAGKAFSQPAPGRGAVYVYQEQSGVVLDVTANQRTLGTLGAFNYLRTELPPGHYELRASANNATVASLPIDVRAGEIRYVRASAAPPAYSLRAEPASAGQPAILAGSRVRDLKFLEVPP